MQLRRIFANAFARRIAYALAGLVLAALGIDAARAQACPAANATIPAYQVYADQGAAYQACMAAGNAANGKAQSGYIRNFTGCDKIGTQTVYGANFVIALRNTDCAAVNVGTATRLPNFAYPANATCSSRQTLPDGWFQVGSGPTCKDGCEYGGAPSPGTTSVQFDALSFRRETGGQAPTGSVCDGGGNPSSPLQQQQCSTVGTLTQCMLPDGRHCAQSTGGKRFCWQPTEAGSKYDQNDGATKSPSGIPSNPPPKPPSNNGNWQQTGQGTTTVINNGNSTTYNNTTYQSTYGGSGGNTGSTGSDGTDTGGGDDGEEGDGNGTVSGGGNCSSPPAFSGGDPVQNYASGLVWQVQCQGQADAAAAGEVAGILDGLNDCVHNLDCGDVGDDGLPLDDADPSNLSDNPLADFQEEITEDDLELSEAGFLGGGSCPQGLSVPVGNTSVSLTFGPLCEVLLNIGGLIMAIAYFVAFRIIAGGL